MDIDRLEETVDEGPDWSVSRLQTIFSCGRKYRYKYIDKIEEPKTVPLVFGSAVHKCLETMHWQNRWDDTYLQRLWSDTWFETQFGLEWDKVPHRKGTYDKKGLGILESYRDTHSTDEWLALESHFRFQLFDTPVLRGTFDKIMWLQGLEGEDAKYNGRLAVIDYKTSKHPPDALLLRVDPQLTIYHAAARELLGEDVALAIHWLPGNTLHFTERTDTDLYPIVDMIRVGMNRVESEQFERNISWNCRYCPFKEACLGGLARGGP